jgi:uncharacterized protein YbcI
MGESEPRASSRSPQFAISNGMVALMREWTGRGPTKATTTIVGDMVIVRLEDVLLKAENQLIAKDHADAVLDMRRRFQLAMRDTMVALVEETLGRKVDAFLSDQHFDPDIAVEMFVLGPPDETHAAGDSSDPRA